LVVKNFIA